MIVESLGSITFVNGILRVQTLSINSKGEYSESGSIEIPGNKVGDIINALAAGTQGISDKLESESSTLDEKVEKDKSSNKKKKGKKS